MNERKTVTIHAGSLIAGMVLMLVIYIIARLLMS